MVQRGTQRNIEKPHNTQKKREEAAQKERQSGDKNKDKQGDENQRSLADTYLFYCHSLLLSDGHCIKFVYL
jgi:hypothetical protein